MTDVVTALVAPVRAERERIDAEIETLKTALDLLTEDRRKLDKILAIAAPAPKPVAKTNGKVVSDGEIDKVLDFLRSYQGEFTKTSALRDWREAGGAPSEYVVATAFKALHERGQLRLVRVAQGGSNIFAVVR